MGTDSRGAPQREPHPTLPQSTMDLGSKHSRSFPRGAPPPHQLVPGWAPPRPFLARRRWFPPLPSCAAQIQAKFITHLQYFISWLLPTARPCLTHRTGGCRHLPAQRGAVRAVPSDKVLVCCPCWPALGTGPEGGPWRGPHATESTLPVRLDPRQPDYGRSLFVLQ